MYHVKIVPFPMKIFYNLKEHAECGHIFIYFIKFLFLLVHVYSM